MPPTFDFGQHCIDGAGGDVPLQHPVEPIALLLDDAHPMTKGALAVRCERVHTSALRRRRLLWRRPHQPISLELGKGAVDARTIDASELQRPHSLGESIAVAWLLGEQEQDRRQQEVARRGHLEPSVRRR
jgi:hypothetical protein